MNEAFKKYFMENFFQNNEIEFKNFIESLSKNIPKSLRVNTNKITTPELVKRLENTGWELTPTFIPNVFYTRRWEDFIENERRLGFTLEHLQGYFYIQELGASSSVHYLTDGKIYNEPYLILDVASSPGGKTTQLSEHFPDSYIIWNEFDKNRLPQLISNIERMWAENIALTYYNWLFFGRFTETFDRILLDAPCSWEWVWFKVQNNLKYRNLKNIKKIADLQAKLLEAAANALKVWWEMIYSTCTLNKEENELVVESLTKKHPECFEILFEKRFWPHIDQTGWFFVCRIKKLKSIEYRIKDKEVTYNEWIKKLNRSEQISLDRFCEKYWLNLDNYRLYTYKQEILVLPNFEWFWDIITKFYLIKFGKKIWRIEQDKFIPHFHLGRDFELSKTPKYEIKDEKELDFYLRWNEIWENLKDELVQLVYKNENIGLGFVDTEIWKIKNIFPTQWMRK